MKKLGLICLSILGFLFFNVGMAGVPCQGKFYDSTCSEALLKPIVNCSGGRINNGSACVCPSGKKWSNNACVAVAQPSCPTGYKKLKAPTWDFNSSRWVGLSCSFTPTLKPRCPSGSIQKTSATWNGNSWVGLSCTASSGSGNNCSTNSRGLYTSIPCGCAAARAGSLFRAKQSVADAKLTHCNCDFNKGYSCYWSYSGKSEGGN